MDFYFPSKVSQEHLVGMLRGYTCISEEANEELASEMMSFAREDLTAEQVENLVENTDLSKINLWELHNKLIAYVEGFMRRDFTEKFTSVRNKYYIGARKAVNVMINSRSHV